MNLSQALREQIKNQLSVMTAAIGVVVAENLDETGNPNGSFVIQPVDNEPPLFNVIALSNNKPKPNSYVIYQYLDEQNAYITGMMEFERISQTTQIAQLQTATASMTATQNINIQTQKDCIVAATEDIVLESNTLTFNTQDTLKELANTIQLTSTLATTLDGNGVKITSNGIQLSLILTDILGALTAINTAIATLTGTPPAAAQIATLTTNIPAFNA
jgi:hypothetical protein